MIQIIVNLIWLGFQSTIILVIISIKLKKSDRVNDFDNLFVYISIYQRG